MAETSKHLSAWSMIIPDKVFSERIRAVTPSVSNYDINKALDPFESEYQHLCGSIDYSKDPPGRILVLEKNNLRIFEKLGIISDEERNRLKEIELQFSQTVQEVVSTTGGDPNEVERNIDLTLGFYTSTAHNLSESKRILINGPVINGFEETNDPQILNTKVLQFVQDSFGIESLTKAKVGGISKDDKWYFYLTPNKSEVGRKIIQSGIAKLDRSNTLITDTKEEYLKGAMLLEEVDTPQELKHVYKLRAEASDMTCFSNFSLHSIGIEKSSDFDYLEGAGLKTEDDKMRAYILGTIAHEVLHRYHTFIDKNVLAEYQNIVQQEISSKRKYGVSDYVLKHQEIYGTDNAGITEEDMAESVRIYVTNSAYLSDSYPLRLAFIEKHLPFIQKDTAVKTILN